jgi:putative phosphonate metabolism protein
LEKAFWTKQGFPDQSLASGDFMHFQRYAIYYTPPDGALADFGASWLGWDIRTGKPVPESDISGLSEPIRALTKTPHRYGLHATLKPPFRLANHRTEPELQTALATLATTLAPVTLNRLKLVALGRFLALVPENGTNPVARLAAKCVRDLDSFRAPLAAQDLARRDTSGLSDRKKANLAQWGYPHVMEDFKFHMTLTGKLEKSTLSETSAVLQTLLQPVLEQTLSIDRIILAGESESGYFHQISCARLTG